MLFLQPPQSRGSRGREFTRIMAYEASHPFMETPANCSCTFIAFTLRKAVMETQLLRSSDRKRPEAGEKLDKQKSAVQTEVPKHRQPRKTSF